MQEETSLGTEKLKVKRILKIYRLQSVSEIISETISHYEKFQIYVPNPKILKLEVISRNRQFSTTKE